MLSYIQSDIETSLLNAIKFTALKAVRSKSVSDPTRDMLRLHTTIFTHACTIQYAANSTALE